MSDVVAIAGAVSGVAGVLFGLGGVYFAVAAKKAAEHANRLAEGANEAAVAAVALAGEANGLAVEANQLAGDANAISKRALAVSADQLEYNWVLQVEDDGVAVVVNDCAHEAADVSVVIDSGGEIHAQTAVKDVAGFGQIPLDLAGALAEHFERARRNPAVQPWSDSGGVFAGRKGKIVETVFRATVAWRTPTGVDRSCAVQDAVRHSMQYDGQPKRLRR